MTVRRPGYGPPMRHSPGMHQVELVEDDGPPAGATAPSVPAPRPRRSRRWHRRAWPVPLLLVAAVLVSARVGDVAEHERADRRLSAAQGVDGVLSEITEDIAFVPLSDDGWVAVVRGVRVHDVVVGPTSPVGPHPGRFLGVDALSGEVLWTWQPDQEPGTATASAGYTGTATSCWQAGDDVTCAGTHRPATEDEVAGTPASTRVLTFEPATGEVLADSRHDGAAVGHGDEGLTVLAETTPKGLSVTALRTATGEPTWAIDLLAAVDAPAHALSSGLPVVAVSARTVRVLTSYHAWVLDPGDGAVLAEGEAAGGARLGRTAVGGGADWSLLSADGEHLGALSGSPLPLRVDDGSAPEVELVGPQGNGYSALAAHDAGDGSTLWTEEIPDFTGSGGILLDSVLYHGAPDELAAWDVRTGERRWTVELPTAEQAGMVTDGNLLVTLAVVDGRSSVVARSTETGERLWHAPTTLSEDARLFPWSGAAPTAVDGNQSYLVVMPAG